MRARPGPEGRGNPTAGASPARTGSVGWLRFRCRIELSGVNPFVRVDARRAGELCSGWRRPMPVLARVNGQPRPPWRINMMPVGDGSFNLFVRGKVLESSDTGVGDLVEVSLKFDRSYRGGPAHPLPARFSTGLRRSPTAERAWGKLPASRQKEILRYLASLRTPTALERNVDRALRVLEGFPGRFLGRDWGGSAASRSPSQRG